MPPDNRVCLLLPFLLLLVGGDCLRAQITISRQVLAAGALSGDQRGRNYLRFTATIGQPLTGTFGRQTITTVGFQQPDIDGIVPVLEVGDRRFEVSVYPNPVTTRLRIELGDAARELVALELTDALGRRLLERTLPPGVEQIDLLRLDRFPSGTYYLRATGRDGRRYALSHLVFVPR